MNCHDVICAISTPAGVGGIAVVRLSGDIVKALAERFLQGVALRDRHAHFCELRDGDEFIDEVVATFFEGPHSYTGEDVVEISCHGSLYVQQRILRLFVDNGARLAEPGEFTQRAFLNRRLNLSQAEAVADLIDARSESAHKLAVSQIRGGYAQELEALRRQLIDTAALLELELDFSEEDLEFVSRDRIRTSVEELKGRVEALVASFQMGNALKNGVPVAIVGAPNVGKSTLLNRLLCEDRAIVSDIPGTTRDTVEEQFVIDGFLFRLIDTAGIRNTDDKIEKAGIERSREAVRRAMIVIYVVDNDDCDSQIGEIKEMMGGESQSLIVVRNKVDCFPSSHQSFPCIAISAKEGLGIDELKKQMVAVVGFRETQSVTMTNARHYEAMKHLLSALDEVCKGIEAGLTPDLIVIDLRDALYHLGTITGSVTSDEVLSSVFSRFCVGK